MNNVHRTLCLYDYWFFFWRQTIGSDMRVLERARGRQKWKCQPKYWRLNDHCVRAAISKKRFGEWRVYVCVYVRGQIPVYAQVPTPTNSDGDGDAVVVMMQLVVYWLELNQCTISNLSNSKHIADDLLSSMLNGLDAFSGEYREKEYMQNSHQNDSVLVIFTFFFWFGGNGTNENMLNSHNSHPNNDEDVQMFKFVYLKQNKTTTKREDSLTILVIGPYIRIWSMYIFNS